jgi:hypothetical protein
MCSPQVNDKLTGELPLFCPLERCSHYQKPDNPIKKRWYLSDAIRPGSPADSLVFEGVINSPTCPNG